MFLMDIKTYILVVLLLKEIKKNSTNDMSNRQIIIYERFTGMCTYVAPFTYLNNIFGITVLMC